LLLGGTAVNPAERAASRAPRGRPSTSAQSMWLVPHDGVFYLAPVFALAAVFFGTINGLVAGRLLLAEGIPPAPDRAPPPAR
jgi:hypothetical protein